MLYPQDMSWRPAPDNRRTWVRDWLRSSIEHYDMRTHLVISEHLMTGLLSPFIDQWLVHTVKCDFGR